MLKLFALTFYFFFFYSNSFWTQVCIMTIFFLSGDSALNCFYNLFYWWNFFMFFADLIQLPFSCMPASPLRTLSCPLSWTPLYHGSGILFHEWPIPSWSGIRSWLDCTGPKVGKISPFSIERKRKIEKETPVRLSLGMWTFKI